MSGLDDALAPLLAELHDAMALADAELTGLVDAYRDAVAENDLSGLLGFIRRLDEAEPDALKTFTLAAVRRLATQAVPA